MNEVAWRLVWGGLQLTAVGLAGTLLYGALGRRRPAARAGILAITLVAMFAASGLSLSPWSRWYSAPEWWPVQAAPTAILAPPTPAVDAAVSDVASAAGAAGDDAATSVATMQFGHSDPPEGPPADRSRHRAALPPEQRWTLGVSTPLAVLATIGVGIVGGLSWCILGLVSLARLRAGSRAAESPRLQALLADLTVRLGQRRRVAVRVTPALLAPATVGWRRPIVYLPENWGSWSNDELAAVLAHELAHVARNDYLSTLVVQFCRAGTWYHPWTWWLARRARLEQELAADAWAAALVGGPRSYLVHLAKLALAQERSAAWGPVQAFVPDRRSLEARVQSLEVGIRDHQPVRGQLSQRGGWLILATGLGLTLAVTGLREPWFRSARAEAVLVTSEIDDEWFWRWTPAGVEAAGRLSPGAISSAERKQIQDRFGLDIEELVPWDQVTELWIARQRSISPGASALAPLGVVLAGDPIPQVTATLNLTTEPAKASGSIAVPSVAANLQGNATSPSAPGTSATFTGSFALIDFPVPPSLVVIRSREPLSWPQGQGPPPEGWRPGSFGDRRYWYLNDARGVTIVLAALDERTIALTDPAELVRIWGEATPGPVPAWTAAWKAAAPQQVLLAAQSPWLVARLKEHQLPGPLAIPALLVEHLLRGSTWCLIEQTAPLSEPDSTKAALLLRIGFDEPPAEVWADSIRKHAQNQAQVALQALARETAELPQSSRARWDEEAALARQTIESTAVRVVDDRLEVELSGVHVPVLWHLIERALVFGPAHRQLPVLSGFSLNSTSPVELEQAGAQFESPPSVDVIGQQLSFVEAAQVATARQSSRANLTRIGQAIQAYLAEHGEYPRARFDDAGNPLLSWRVMILPQLGEADLYAEFHLDEPWNSPHNRRLLARRPEVYHTPRAGGGGERPDAGERTGYSSAYGTGLVFDGNTPRRPPDLADGADQTIFAYQGPRGAEIFWTEPTGFYLDNLGPDEVERFRAWLARATHRLDDTVYNVLMADGSVRGLARNIDAKLLASLVSISGNDRVKLPPLKLEP